MKFILLLAIAGLLLWWFGRRLDWAEVSASVRAADWRMLAAAVVLVCITYLVRALRWRALLAPLAQNVGLRELFAATTVGFGALFLAGRAGEVVRPLFLAFRERRVDAGAALVTIAVERIYDMVAVVVLFAINLLVFQAPNSGAAEFARVRQAGLVLLVGASFGIAALVWFRQYSHTVIVPLERKFGGADSFIGRVAKTIVGILKQLAAALGVLVDKRELAITIAWTILLWGLIIGANWLVYTAFGLNFGLGETVFVLGWSLVGSLVPTPGGAAGAFHAATAGGLMFLGVAANTAAAVSLIIHPVLFGPAVFFGLYYFLRSDVRLARLRQLAHAPANEINEGKASASSPQEAVS
ncbi:MAG: lysylphosphatidylglycerol synthase transmembrane domain-containing protein [Pyrinomonadaceae bacterium]